MLCIFVALLASFVFVAAGSAIPVYQPVPVDANSGNVVIYDIAETTTYGTAKIDYHYWYDETTSYWHYAYQIFNNDLLGDNTSSNPDTRLDDYHLGHTQGTYNATPDSINKFGITLDVTDGVDDLAAVGFGGSTRGGTGWAPSAGYDVLEDLWLGMDWTVTGSAGMQIQPAQWSYARIKGTWTWTPEDAGDASLDDSTGQYFELASLWGPDWVSASVVTSWGSQASGDVIGPGTAPIPEPASCVLLALGAIGLFSKRNKK